MLSNQWMLALASVTAAVSIFGAGSAAGPRLVPSDGYSYETQTVSDRIHLVFRPDPARVPAEGNVEVIEQADGLVVVDAGGSPRGGRRVVNQIRKISPKPVRYLIYTHWHGDHNLGAPAFRAAYPGIRIISTRKTWENMTGKPMEYVATLRERYHGGAANIAKVLADPTVVGDRRTRLEQVAVDAPRIADAYEGARAVPADMTFSDRLDIPDPQAPVQVLFLGRANTDGDAIVWAPKQKVLITGDIVVSPYPFGTGSYPGEWIKVLRRLEAYDFTTLVPGHGPLQTDRAYLDRLIALIEDIRTQVAPPASAGRSLDEIRQEVNFDRQYALFAGDSTYLHDVFRRNFVEPMEMSAFKEARGEAISQDP